MSDELVTIQIDGISLQAPKGTMLITVADSAGIKIPRFCYHEKLSIAANCRMCLVEVEKAPKPLPACATPVMEGMVVYTKSPSAIEAQKGTMEFLLINHPLDCPICDQGGECELQDVSIGYGRVDSRYVEKKRVVKDKDIGPLIATDLTRCIHCTRCVRFGEEIAGFRELGATGRGEHMEIGTYIQKTLNSELSGNIIDLCPVGALTSKPFRYKARSWELIKKDTIAPHDCVGSNISVHIREQEVLRVVPRSNEDVNECWLSDRDRFSYEGLNQQRLLKPKIKEAGEWKEVEWEEALTFAIEGIRKVIESDGADKIGGLISPNATTEEHYLLQKLIRGLGSDNIDHRLRQIDFNETQIPWLGQSIADLENVQAALVIGSYTRIEQPLLSHRLRKAALKGANIMMVNPIGFDMNFDINEFIVAPTLQMADHLAAILKALAKIKEAALPDGLNQLFTAVEPDESAVNIAETLNQAKCATVLLGTIATAHPEYHLLRTLAGEISVLSGATFGILTDGANATGAWLVGAVPKGNGKSVDNMLEGDVNAFLLHNFEPRHDSYNPGKMLGALKKATFVLELSAYENPDQEHYADVLLPITPFSETSGTFVNCEGRWQSFKGIVPPLGESRPGWKVMRVLGNIAKVDGFEYRSSANVLAELKRHSAELNPLETESLWSREAAEGTGLSRIGLVSLYAVDSIVRRANALQMMDVSKAKKVQLSERTAETIGAKAGDLVSVAQGEHQINLELETSSRIPDGCAVVPSYLGQDVMLDAMYGDITVTK